jgi:hypothetical protein
MPFATASVVQILLVALDALRSQVLFLGHFSGRVPIAFIRFITEHLTVDSLMAIASFVTFLGQ